MATTVSAAPAAPICPTLEDNALVTIPGALLSLLTKLAAPNPGRPNCVTTSAPLPTKPAGSKPSFSLLVSKNLVTSFDLSVSLK